MNHNEALLNAIIRGSMSQSQAATCNTSITCIVGSGDTCKSPVSGSKAQCQAAR